MNGAELLVLRLDGFERLSRVCMEVNVVCEREGRQCDVLAKGLIVLGVFGWENLTLTFADCLST